MILEPAPKAAVNAELDKQPLCAREDAVSHDSRLQAVARSGVREFDEAVRLIMVKNN